MSYPVDTALLHSAGQMLSQHATLGAEHVRALLRQATRDDVLTTAESVALLVIWLAAAHRCDEEAREAFSLTALSIRLIDDDLEPWVIRSFSRPILIRGVDMLAERGSQPLSKDDLRELLRLALNDGHASTDESRAVLVVVELFGGRLTQAAAGALPGLRAACAEDGVTLGSPPPPAASSRQGSSWRQCGSCAGTGRVTCRSCGGYGSHRRSGTRTRGGRTEYYQENVPCSCSGGRQLCGSCGGSGRVYG